MILTLTRCLTHQLKLLSMLILNLNKFAKKKSSNRLIIAQLNINSIRNKFDSLNEIIKDNIGVLLISETKTDSSFPTAQFYIDGFTTYRRDRNINNGGIILYIRDHIPSTLLNTDTSVEDLYVEINVRKKMANMMFV